MKNYFAQPRPEMLPFVPARRDRILDVGCGAGEFIASIPGVGETWGVEPSAAGEVAAKRLTKVLRGTFADVAPDLPTQYFDVIICNDVIEHMSDHVAFLSVVGNYLKPGGVVIGSIPNVLFYNNFCRLFLEKDWMYEDSGILDRTHVAFFTRKSFLRTMRACGLEVVHITGINRNILLRGDRRTRTYRMACRLLGVMSLGYWTEMQFLQFGFQAKSASQ